MHTTDVQTLLAEFRAARRELESRLYGVDADRMTAPLMAGAWSAREVVIHIAAWLTEAAERIPALRAGSPPRNYDADAFNAAALRAAAAWSPVQALGAFKRAADRFETIAAELTDETLNEEPDVRAWLESAARVMITEHLDDLTRAIKS